ncbi:TPA: glycosyltransferase family 2 protein [Bacillus cereus]|nr:glycosyltransferase family 2 protein [Bacillus cereus]
MKYSIIIRCYNTLPLIKECVEAVMQSTGTDTEIILINNHPPYKDVIEYLENLNDPRITVLDPGYNIGNLEGFNYGAERANGENLIILDDDIIVPNNDWIDIMFQTLCDFPNFAYVSLLCSHVESFLLSNRKDPKNKIIKKEKYTIQITPHIVIFGCIMLKKTLWKQYFSNIKLERIPLYDIDVHYGTIANNIGMEAGYIISHFAKHLGRSKESDQLYGAWKILYVCDLTLEDYVGWRNNKKTLTQIEESTLKKYGYNDVLIDYLKDKIKDSLIL